MKKLITMAALTVAAFGFNQANAQKVIKDAAGAVYIDVQDMLAGAFSTSSISVIRAAEHAGNSVFKKLQIAKADLPMKISWAEACGLSTSYNSNSAIGQAQGAVNTGCKTYSAEGNEGQWRVPTMKELMLMWIMKDLLVQMGVGPFVSTNYWTSNEYGTYYSWFINFTGGATSDGGKTNTTTNNTRCVREVTN